jgi:manganese-dependent inorganic pyrophosphatase
MKKLQAEQGYQDIVFMLTDIKSEGSELLVVGKNEGEISAAFNTTLSNQSVWIPGLMSRKKQVVPALSMVYN